MAAHDDDPLTARRAALDVVAAAHQASGEADRAVLDAITAARQVGVTWRDLGAVFGSDQLAQRRYGRPSDAADPGPMWSTSARLHDDVRDVIHGYLARMPGAFEANTSDPVYRTFLQWAATLLRLVNIAMHDEGIGDDRRIRVLRVALYGGAPSHVEAQERMARHAARVEELAHLITPHVVKDTDG